MTQHLNTCLYWQYDVSAPEECTVTDSRGNGLGTARPGVPFYFTADGHAVTLSSDAATMLPTRLAGVESSGGEAVLPVQGEALMPHHATWFNNTEQTTLTISPAAWKNEVITCYLKTEVPVALAGVRWLYGEPAMVEGFTYVVALQQIDAATVLANLAYSLKQ